MDPARMSSMTDARARIIDLLRRSPATATAIAAELGMSYHAVRPHLSALRRDRLVQVAGLQRGATRPSVLYELAPGVAATLSKAYVPFASLLVQVLGERLPTPTVDAIMREVGRRLAASLPRPRGGLIERVRAASTVLVELGAPNVVETDARRLRIRAVGCILSEAIHGRPAVCRAMETFLGELLQADVQERCDRGETPRCCFEVKRAS